MKFLRGRPKEVAKPAVLQVYGKTFGREAFITEDTPTNERGETSKIRYFCDSEGNPLDDRYSGIIFPEHRR